ncbi:MULTISPECIES: hypothetical protein [Thermoactinomyces]|uniref:Uncharacterized protein n=1 Tax=Thermoactinomyces daqus TaxID=1329516 RepID=A0A7W1X7Z6_9BACL|nr:MULTISPECIES: hypothetical protein [Thermoactinomyces]MBA4541730.1 hypothetical protein [Thermoactinomyces daqus]MBH8597185.1 hypothetical protein [Thermoactinomyces sp. CICC 10523]MBH8602745.1 hypothetical protein [Thermoactinomyces sp. CICC 10522]MBH8606146.1 hypothetical protein [Thermoactinomyces sp. CICC 10521]
MRCVKRILLAAMALTVLPAGFLYSQKLKAEKSVNPCATDGLCSLKEAYQIARKKARAWDRHAELLVMSSVDDGEKQKAGSEGRRKNWNFIFADLSSEQTFAITMHDGLITKEIPSTEKTDQAFLIPTQLIQLDSTDVIVKVKRHFHVKPGQNRARGSRFPKIPILG